MNQRLNYCLLCTAFSVLTLVGGCVSLPIFPTSTRISSAELSNHVEFLTQPGLKGRSAMSWESQTVRDYLTERLSQYGCKPWPGTDSFEQPFGFGTNVIGVLPGSDPILSKEIVLISAHYDHLPPGWLSYYPGACDNASSVAALLEIAKTLSLADTPPKRSICFAFFDAEEKMCLGSFAFTCRDDYHEDDVVAAINMDLLGRDLLDVVDNCLIATGTENYAPIQKEVSAACGRNGLQFVPFANALVGPTGDHIAFTLAERPVLFFTCGINKDYHQPTDTPDKLNYQKLVKESETVKQTLLTLANAKPKLLQKSPAPITPEETEAFAYILNKCKDNAETLKLDPNDIQVLDKLITQSAEVDPGSITRDDLLELQRQSLNDLLKLLKDYNPTLAYFSGNFLRTSRLYAMQPAAMTQTYKEMVQHYFNHPPSLFGKNEFAYQINLPLTDRDWGIVQLDNDEFLFGAINTEISLQNQIHILKGHRYSFTLKNKLTACQGSLNQIADRLFLGKDPNGLTHQGHEAHHLIGSGKSSVKNGLSTPELELRQEQFLKAFLATLEQNFPENTHRDSFQKYYDPNTFLTDPNSCACKNSRSIFLRPFLAAGNKKKVKQSQSKKISQKEAVAYTIKQLQDISKHVEDRADCLGYLAHVKSRKSLIAIADVIDDPTLFNREKEFFNHPAFPLKDHPYMRQYQSSEQKHYEKLKDKTLGQIACEKLKKVTKKDFATDKEVWKQWIEKHYQQDTAETTSGR